MKEEDVKTWRLIGEGRFAKDPQVDRLIQFGFTRDDAEYIVGHKLRIDLLLKLLKRK